METHIYNPEEIRFPYPNSLRVLELYFNSIITNIYNNNDINIINTSYIIPIIFKGYETLVEISSSMHPYEQFNIKIGNEINEDEPCLHIRFYYDKEVVAKLVFVRSKNVICSIPEANAGTWMVELTNSIVNSLGINIIYLEDDAVIDCNGIPDRFLFLRIYHGDTPSWYQKFGYEINLNTNRVQNRYPGYNKQKYSADIYQLNNYSFSKILDGLNNLEKVYNKLQEPFNKIILDDGIATINVINRNPSPEITLGEYMSKLWIENCEDYLIINKFLRSSSAPHIDPAGIYFNWAPLFNRIDFVSYDYIRSIK